MNLSSATIRDLSESLKSKDISSEELVTQYKSRIDDQNENINALLSISDSAIEEAKEIDKRRANGEDLGLLAGIPVIIKDNILVKDWENTAGSQILKGHKSSYDSTVVKRLKDAGAILLGKANMDEFGMGSSGENSSYGPTKNPWDENKVAGGSSSGSVAAVAAGFAPLAFGSDTGGSIRQPASLNNLVGLKPTYGRVSRYGLMALASSLDTIGPIARTVEDAAWALQAIEGNDPKDATTVESAETSIPELIDGDLKGMKVGIPKQYFLDEMDQNIRELVENAIKELESSGAELVEISMPHTEYALATYYIILPAEASSNLGRYDGMRYGSPQAAESLIESYEKTRSLGFGPEVKRRIMIGSYVLSAGYYDAYYRQALKARSLIKKDFDEAFKKVDIIASPTSPSVAWDIGAKFNDPLTMYLSDIFTISPSLATIPAISIPCGFDDGLPVGMQLMAKPFDEASLFRAGINYQQKTDWHKKTP